MTDPATDLALAAARLRGELACSAAVVRDSTRSGLCASYAAAAGSEIRTHGLRYLADFATAWSDLIDDLDR